MKLTKSQRAELAEHQKMLRSDRELIHAQFLNLLEHIDVRLNFVNRAIKDHNQRLGKARTFVASVAGELRDEFEAHSEKWQESEAGQAAQAMLDEWEDADLDDVAPVTVLAPDHPHFEEGLNLTEDSSD